MSTAEQAQQSQHEPNGIAARPIEILESFGLHIRPRGLTPRRSAQAEVHLAERSFKRPLSPYRNTT